MIVISLERKHFHQTLLKKIKINKKCLKDFTLITDCIHFTDGGISLNKYLHVDGNFSVVPGPLKSVKTPNHLWT